MNPLAAQVARLPLPWTKPIATLPPHCWGWCAEPNRRRLAELAATANVFVEVGSWLGESSILIAERLPPGGVLYCVDTWVGSAEHYTDPCWAAELPMLFEQFQSNVVHAGVGDKVRCVRLPSTEAARFDVHADVVYLDGAHDFDSVAADIDAWWEKTKVLCGDDYDPVGWPEVVRVLDEFRLLKVDPPFWELSLP